MGLRFVAFRHAARRNSPLAWRGPDAYMRAMQPEFQLAQPLDARRIVVAMSGGVIEAVRLAGSFNPLIASRLAVGQR